MSVHPESGQRLAKALGVLAARQSVPVEKCPYRRSEQKTMRMLWLRGYRSITPLPEGAVDHDDVPEGGE
ncbi:hypothetical protein GCM10022221_67470 [Actinocorallia aurea]